MRESGFFLMLWGWFKSYKEDRLDFLFQYTEDRKAEYNLPSYRSMYFIAGLFGLVACLFSLYFSIDKESLFNLANAGVNVVLILVVIFLIELAAVFWPLIHIGAGVGHGIARMLVKNTLQYWILAFVINLAFWGILLFIIILNSIKTPYYLYTFAGCAAGSQILAGLCWFILYGWALISKPKPLITEIKDNKKFDSTLDQHLLDGNEDI